jgi:hypothetical protein
MNHSAFYGWTSAARIGCTWEAETWRERERLIAPPRGRDWGGACGLAGNHGIGHAREMLLRRFFSPSSRPTWNRSTVHLQYIQFFPDDDDKGEGGARL